MKFSFIKIFSFLFNHSQKKVKEYTNMYKADELEHTFEAIRGCAPIYIMSNGLDTVYMSIETEPRRV